MKTVNSHQTIQLAGKLLGCLDGQIAASVRALLEQGRHKEMLDIRIDPDSPTLQDDYLATELLSKSDFLDMGVDRSSVAISKFLAIESDLQNVGLRWLNLSILRQSSPKEFPWIFHSAKQKIDRLLGSFDLNELETGFSFGPGASYEIPRRRAHASNKYGSSKPTVTMGCLDLAIAAVRRHRAWADYLCLHNGPNPLDWFELVKGNRIVTVPKNAKTDRVIAIEPTMNMYIQKGLGAMIRRRLKRVGVNLDCQVLNQHLALQGSLSGSLATIDLSAASDSISSELVRWMLPPDWVSYIKACRSPFGVLPDGSEHLYRKVSSMGNGFTFELESLIFWALAEASVDLHGKDRHGLAVYGDDLIVPSDCADDLISALSVCGFTTNKSKTFVTGNFRESCGKHYSHGRDVTPIYIRNVIDGVERLIWFANAVCNLSLRYGEERYRDIRFKFLHEEIVDLIPKRFKKFGPLRVNGGVTDLWIGSSFDQCMPSRAPNWLEGFIIEGVSRRYDSKPVTSQGGVIHYLDRTRFDRYDSEVTISEVATQRFKLRPVKVLVKQYEEIPPWF